MEVAGAPLLPQLHERAHLLSKRIAHWSDAATLQLRLLHDNATDDIQAAKLRRAHPPRLEWQPLKRMETFAKGGDL